MTARETALVGALRILMRLLASVAFHPVSAASASHRILPVLRECRALIKLCQEGK